MANVQFNLLPPSKYQAMSNEAREAQIVRKAIMAALACAALFVLLLAYTEGVQKAQISSSKSAVDSKSSKLEKVSNISTIITVQNQLAAASSLHSSQHDTSRIFNYLSKITPPTASVNNLSLDTKTNLLKIDGSADSATTVNALVDTLKYTQYKVGASDAKAAFSSVVETNFAISQVGVTYSITANFDPTLFANDLTDANGKAIAPQLIVPNSTTTRGGNDPGSLFGGGR